MTLADVSSAVDALESSLSAVHGADDRTRRYAPMSLGAFADALDEFADGGWTVERLSTARAHIHDAAATYNIVADEDGTVAQLLQGKEAWTAIESVLKAHIHGDIGGDLQPSEGASASEKLVWLKAQADRVADVAKQYRDKASDLGKEEAQAIRNAGRKAADAVRRNAVALKRGAEKAVKDEANRVIDTAKGALTTAAWGATIPVGLLIVAGIVIYTQAKSGKTQRRIDSYRETVTRGAKQAGVM